MTAGTPRPPRVATWLIGQVLPDSDRDAVLGDLAEEYTLLTQSASSADASAWYWQQTATSVLPVVWWSLRKAAGLGTIAVAIGAFLVATVVETAVESFAGSFVTRGSLQHWIISLLIALAAMALGGYLAASLRPYAARALAVIVFVLIIGLMIAVPNSVPLWYQWSCLPLGPLAVLAGGRLHRDSRKSRV